MLQGVMAFVRMYSQLVCMVSSLYVRTWGKKLKQFLGTVRDFCPVKTLELCCKTVEYNCCKAHDIMTNGLMMSIT